MNRCSILSCAALRLRDWLFAALLCSAALAGAQTAYVRPFPADVHRATMVITQPPLLTMNGQSERLSPGARIHGTNNMLVMSAALANQPLVVNYRRDSGGQVSEVWILTPTEAAVRLHTFAQ